MDLTFEKLTELEPRLARLEADILEHTTRYRGTARYCANRHWYGWRGQPGFKTRMLYLVGFHADNPALRTMRAYDVAYHHLYYLLPDCDHDESVFC
jgi:hypothetical protein